MMKTILDLTVRSVEPLSERHVLLRLTHGEPLPDMLPGQFVEVRIDETPGTFLRRPISINMVDRQHNELWLMVAMVGNGTRRLGSLHAGDVVNCVLPLGNGFTAPTHLPLLGEALCAPQLPLQSEGAGGRPLLIGGGVGVAPLLYLGAALKAQGVEPTFLLGGRSEKDVLELDLFKQYGRVCVTTEDGTLGEQGFVTNHSVLGEQFDRIFTCGPTPMMKAVASYATEHGIECEASLENLMACGLGACLCCVEKTKEGNVCVCKEGPVFNIKRLLW